MDVRALLAANLKSLRAARGLSQEALADHAKLDRTYISSLERCRYAASVDAIGKLATALAVRPHELLLSVGADEASVQQASS
jgi:transcriptional regulator with XRE-family HTH domain